MNPERYVPLPTVIVVALVTLILTAVPLPRLIGILRPDFVTVAVIAFAIFSPRSAGLLFGFLMGLALDAFKGVVLGQHALALTTIAFVALNLRLRIRMFSVAQQALVVLFLLALMEFIVFWVDGVTGHPITDGARWLHIVSGALLWLLVPRLIDRLATARRY
jgi:rod shape-determining protein MreD